MTMPIVVKVSYKPGYATATKMLQELARVGFQITEAHIKDTMAQFIVIEAK